MESILDAVVRIEKEAKAIAEKVEKQQNGMDAEERDLLKIRQDYEEKARQRIEAVREAEAERLAAQSDGIEKDLAERLEQIESEYRQNGARWTDALYADAVREYRE